jgi:short-subunit dehydrogenase
MVSRINDNTKYVINVGGIFGGINPCAGFAVYGATKAFVDSFSRALHKEYSGSSIHVQVFKLELNK